MGLFRQSEAERAARRQALREHFGTQYPYTHKVLGVEGDWAWNPIHAIELVCEKMDELEQRIAQLER